MKLTQKGTVLTADHVEIGNQYSDIDVSVSLTDDTFESMSYVGVYVATPGKQLVWPYEIKDGKATIGHEALSASGDVWISIGGYTADTQLTTNAIKLLVLDSNNPSGKTVDIEDWKEQLAEQLIVACIHNDSYLAAQATAISNDETAREIIADAAAQYAKDNGLASVNVVDGLGSDSGTSALSAKQGKLLNAKIADKDTYPTEESTKYVTSGGVASALDDLINGFNTNKNYVRIGNIQICVGSASITGVEFASGDAEGNVYRKIISAPKAVSWRFPMAFSDNPTMLFAPTKTARCWWGYVNADTIGLADATIWRAETGTVNVENSYIAIGRCDPTPAGTARNAMLMSARGKIGTTEVNGTAIGTWVVQQYNDFYPENAQSLTDNGGWCSEFASWCLYESGAPTSVAPYFASAKRGSLNYYNIDQYYKAVYKKISDDDVTCVMTKGTVNVSGTTYTYTANSGGATINPRPGDVVWLSGTSLVKSGVVDVDNWNSKAEPSHSGIVTGYDGRYLYTIEGNRTYGGVNTVIRGKYDLQTPKYNSDYEIYAIGHVDYELAYPGSSSGSWSPSTSGGDDSDDDATIAEIKAWVQEQGYAIDGDLATVAHTGSYNSLKDKPTIPDGMAKLTFSGAVTAEYDGSSAVTVTIPSGGSGGDSGSGSIDLADYRTAAAQDTIDNAQNTEISSKADATHNHDTLYVKQTDLLDSIYPVGCIYLSINSTNPGSLFGGTWAVFARGRMLVGIDTTDSDFSTAETTGGDKTAPNEIPPHAHTATLTGTTNSAGAHDHSVNLTFDKDAASGTAKNRVAPAPNGGSTTTAYTTGSGGNHSHTTTVSGTTDSAGDAGSTHNNMPPYVAVYMWKRTA